MLYSYIQTEWKVKTQSKIENEIKTDLILKVLKKFR